MTEPKKRVVFLKLSGERLSKDGVGWDSESLKTACGKIARIYKLRRQMGIEGIVFVPGAGNIIRGEKLKERGIAPKRADMLGRLGTIMNSLVIAEALEEIGVPSLILIAKEMAFKNDDFKLEEYDANKLKAAFGQEKIVIIAGGSGKDNVTTDYAVVLWAGDYQKHNPADEVVVLKGTKWDGVYEEDPAKVKGVRPYKVIGAPMMQKDYRRFSAIDERSLQEIISSGLEMLVYADEQHDLETILRHDSSSGIAIGTLIVPRDIEPTFY